MQFTCHVSKPIHLSLPMISCLLNEVSVNTKTGLKQDTWNSSWFCLS